MTLPSTSSIKLYPENTTANYVTQLYKNIELRGDWEVALTEFHFPHTFFNVNHGSNRIKALWRIEGQNSVTSGTVTPGYYKNDEEFLDAVNNVFKGMNLGKIRVNTITRCAYYTEPARPIEPKEKTVPNLRQIREPYITNHEFISLGEVLSRQLGYEPGVNIAAEPAALMPLNLAYGLPSHIYIYSDIAEPHMVGDTNVPLLRMINTHHGKYLFGDEATITPNSLQYIPLAKNQFDNIQIDLRVNSGLPVPFKFGTAAVVLHFRRSSNQ